MTSESESAADPQEAVADSAAPDEKSTSLAAPTRRRRWQALPLLAIAIVVWLVDQLSKNWVQSNLPEGQTVPVLGDFLQWHFVRNPGAAFSLASGSTWVFTLLAIVVVGVILWQLRRLGSRSWALFLALLLGGVLGNLTDRLTRDPGFPVGHVVDFILTPWMWPGMNAAIYNVADIAIVSAMIIFVLITLFGLPLNGEPRRRRASTAKDSDDARESDVDTGTAADVANDGVDEDVDPPNSAVGRGH